MSGVRIPLGAPLVFPVVARNYEGRGLPVGCTYYVGRGWPDRVGWSGSLTEGADAAEHRWSKYLNNGLERDHQFLKGRVRPMRRFKTRDTASTFCGGHALIRNLGRGFTQLAAGAPPRLRLAMAWTTLATLL